MANRDFQNGVILGTVAGGGYKSLPSGEIKIEQNGEYDVSDYAIANVSIPPTISGDITTEKDIIGNISVNISGTIEEAA